VLSITIARVDFNLESFFLSCLAQMPSKSDLTPWISGINIATSVAEAVPVFGAPVKGSLDIVKQILESAQVGCFGL
jgi:hypothetical protein